MRVLALAVLLSAACAVQQPAAPINVSRRDEGMVARVVDGDTLVVRLAGGEDTVRLIGIDTPEVVDPREPVQCFGRGASAEMHRLADHRPLRLEDDGEPRGRDKRMLAYGYPDDR